MVEPEFCNHHDLEADVDVLHPISLVLSKVVLDLFSVDIVKFADLIKRIHAYLFESLAMLHLSEKFKLIIEISDKV